MAIRDLENSVDVAGSLFPAARTATVNGTAVDLRGYGSAMVVVTFGTWTDGTHTPTVQHSVDNSTWVTCDSNSLNGTLTAVSSAGGNSTVQKVGYTGGNRYVRVVMTITGATTGATSAAEVVRGHASQQPL